MKKAVLLFVLCIMIVSACNTPNKDIVLEYRDAEIKGDTAKMSLYLNSSVEVVFSGTSDTLSRDDIILNALFSLPLNPRCETVEIHEIDKSIVLFETLETDELKEILGVRRVGYEYTYKLSHSKICKITVDTLSDADYNYLQVEAEYVEKMNELMKYISSNYPTEYEKIENLDEEAAQIMIHRAKERYGEHRKEPPHPH